MVVGPRYPRVMGKDLLFLFRPGPCPPLYGDGDITKIPILLIGNCKQSHFGRDSPILLFQPPLYGGRVCGYFFGGFAVLLGVYITLSHPYRRLRPPFPYMGRNKTLAAPHVLFWGERV